MIPASWPSIENAVTGWCTSSVLLLYHCVRSFVNRKLLCPFSAPRSCCWTVQHNHRLQIKPHLHSIKRRAGWSDRKQKSRQILSGHVLETSFAAVGKNKLCSITAKFFSILQQIYISVAVLLGAKSFLTKELKDKRFSASTRIETNKQQVSGTKWLSNSQTVI